MKRAILIIFLLISITSCAGKSIEIKAQSNPVDSVSRTISTVNGDVKVKTESKTTDQAKSDTRTYEYPNGDVFHQERYRFLNTTDTSVTLASVEYAGASGTVRYYSSTDKNWHVRKLSEGKLPLGMYFISVEEADFFVCLPQVYVERENDMLEALPKYKGSLEIKKTKNGFVFNIISDVGPKDSQAEYMYVTSSTSLMDWSNPASESIWSGYSFTGSNRWCYTGYYYTTPGNYIPSGKNYYHRLVAAYVPALLTNYNIFRCGDDLYIAMLDVMLELQNSEGYFPTKAGSEWLLNDYGIQAGFYDTRFNCELVKGLVNAYRRFGITEFYDAAVKYGDFFVRYAQDNHFTFMTPSGKAEGWLVYDYGHEKAHKANHSSLNHMAAQITLLYTLQEVTGDTAYSDTANKMLLGLKLTRDKWIMPDGNLEYAYMPDGTMGLEDYPYLTYNDLYELRRKIIARTGKPDTDIQAMLNAKKTWMEKNGITGYKKY